MSFFIGTLIVGDPAYKMLAMFFSENDGFQLWQPIPHMFMHGGICTSFQYVVFFWVLGLGVLESKKFYSSIFLVV
jgi:membrane associated rhomboid family serine protease